MILYEEPTFVGHMLLVYKTAASIELREQQMPAAPSAAGWCQGGATWACHAAGCPTWPAFWNHKCHVRDFVINTWLMKHMLYHPALRHLLTRDVLLRQPLSAAANWLRYHPLA
jgi:hypothetical protein